MSWGWMQRPTCTLQLGEKKGTKTRLNEGVKYECSTTTFSSKLVQFCIMTNILSFMSLSLSNQSTLRCFQGSAHTLTSSLSCLSYSMNPSSHTSGFFAICWNRFMRRVNFFLWLLSLLSEFGKIAASIPLHVHCAMPSTKRTQKPQK